MNRKQFIQSHGATCSNWNWSWSFVNHDKKMVIFGAWDVQKEQERSVILRERWKTKVVDGRTRKNLGYIQAIEHIQLIAEGYDLFTFDMEQGRNDEDRDVAVIKRFTLNLKSVTFEKKVLSGMQTSYLIRFLMKLPHLKTTLKVQKASYSKLLRT